MSATFTSEFRHEFEVEREKLLRRRFLWYAGVVLALGLLNLIGTLVAAYFLPQQMTRMSSIWALLITLIQNLFYVWAFVYVYRVSLGRESILRLVSILIIVSGAISLVATPVVAQIQLNERVRELERRMRERDQSTTQALAEPPLAGGSPAEDADPDDAPGEEAARDPLQDVDRDSDRRGRVQVDAGSGVRIDLDEREIADPLARRKALAYAIVMGTGLGTIFVTHVFACLFLPWTPRESLKPIIPLLGLNALISLWFIDVIPLAVILSILLSPLVAVPGMLICLWRNSRFRERFTVSMLKGRYGEMKQELSSARQIHESLFPGPMTEGPVRFDYRYEPMRQIGGDYLFARSVPATQHGAQPILHMTIIDVTGHGIGAALTVNRLYGEIARQLGEDPTITPGQILTGLNNYLHHTLATHSVYATAVCLRFDPNTSALTWASAGHPPAFLRTVDGRLERLDSTTLVLGACRGDDFHHHEESTRFHPGDMLLLYTDGAIESRNQHGRMLGLAGLESLLASSRPSVEGGYADAILRRVDEYRFGPPQDDTLIVEVWRPLRLG